MARTPPPKKTRRRPRKINPTSLTRRQAAELLGLPIETIDAHLADGAPTLPRRRIHLVHYAAWLARRAGERKAAAP